MSNIIEIKVLETKIIDTRDANNLAEVLEAALSKPELGRLADRLSKWRSYNPSLQP